MGIARTADATGHEDAGALLNRVRRFMRRHVQAGRTGERDAVAEGIGRSADRSWPPPNERWIASRCGSAAPGPDTPCAATSRTRCKLFAEEPAEAGGRASVRRVGLI